MTDHNSEGVTTFQVRAEIEIAASAAKVYDTVSDLPRSGEWSPSAGAAPGSRASRARSARSSAGTTSAARTSSPGPR
ncbi:SRPBCC family protein [Streptomyces sp. M19]